MCQKQACPINTWLTARAHVHDIDCHHSRQSTATSHLSSRLACATTHAPVRSRQKVTFKGLYTVTVCKTTGALRILGRHYNIKASCWSAPVLNSMHSRYQHFAKSSWCNWNWQCMQRARTLKNTFENARYLLSSTSCNQSVTKFNLGIITYHICR